MNQASLDSLYKKAAELVNDMDTLTFQSYEERVVHVLKTLISVQNDNIEKAKPMVTHVQKLENVMNRASQSDVDWQTVREIHKNMVSQIQGIASNIIDPNSPMLYVGTPIAAEQNKEPKTAAREGSISYNLDYSKVKNHDDIVRILSVMLPTVPMELSSGLMDFIE